MREITINNEIFYEEISNYDHVINTCVTVVTGIGNTVNNKFVFNYPQQYKSYRIIDMDAEIQSMTNIVLKEAVTDYTDLIALGNGTVTQEALWILIDRIRARESQ